MDKTKIPTIRKGKVITSISWDLETYLYVKKLAKAANLTLSGFVNKYFADIEIEASELDNFEGHFKFNK